MNYNQNFNAPVTGQVGQGENVSQTQHQGLDAAALAQVFQAMREALSTIDRVEDRDDVAHAIRELEVAVEEDNREQVLQRAGRLQRLAGRVGSTILTTVTTAGTHEILQAAGLS